MAHVEVWRRWWGNNRKTESRQTTERDLMIYPIWISSNLIQIRIAFLPRTSLISARKSIKDRGQEQEREGERLKRLSIHYWWDWQGLLTHLMINKCWRFTWWYFRHTVLWTTTGRLKIDFTSCELHSHGRRRDRAWTERWFCLRDWLNVGDFGFQKKFVGPNKCFTEDVYKICTITNQVLK